MPLVADELRITNQLILQNLAGLIFLIWIAWVSSFLVSLNADIENYLIDHWIEYHGLMSSTNVPATLFYEL